MTPTGSSLVVKDSSGAVVARGTVDPARHAAHGGDAGHAARQWRVYAWSRPPRDRRPHRARDLDLHGRRRANTVAHAGRYARAQRGRDAATDPGPATPSPSAAPTPVPSADGGTTGSGGDVVLPIILALIILGAGAAYLLTRRNRPPSHDVTPTRAAGGSTAAVGRRLVSSLGLALGLAFVLPAGSRPTRLNATYESRLPLAVYLVGAAVTVALSFVFVIVRDVRAAPPVLTRRRSLPPASASSRAPRDRTRRLGVDRRAGRRRWLERCRRRSLFLWVYGWVGLAIVSAVVGPAWHWIDPFSTLHDIGGGVLRRLGMGDGVPNCRTGRATGRPSIGFAAVVWLELVILAGPAGRGLGRLHDLHARGHGPVRPRHVALARRDVQGVVRAARTPRTPGPGRRAGGCRVRRVRSAAA